MIERAQELLEEARVRWFMLDAQQKQIALLAALYFGYTLLDIGGAVAKARISSKGTA